MLDQLINYVNYIYCAVMTCVCQSAIAFGGSCLRIMESGRYFLAQRKINMEGFFYRIGLSIGTRPWAWLITSLFFSLACSSGLLFWKEDLNDVSLFVPKNHPVRKDADWINENFKDEFHYESIIVTAPNVLQPDVMTMIQEIEADVARIIANNNTWNDLCAGPLSWFESDQSEISDELADFMESWTNDLFSWSSTQRKSCVRHSILKIWDRPEANLTENQILDKVSTAMENDIRDANNMLIDIAPLLSGVTYNKDGHIAGATATILIWILKKTEANVAEWETAFIDTIFSSNRSLPKGTRIFALVNRSFEDLLHQLLGSNIIIFFCGFSLISIYVTIMIGRFNMIQQRVYLAMMGVSVVGQALASSYGVCSYLGWISSPVHSVLPFLFLAMGVDHVFVIMQSVENLSDEQPRLKIHKRIAHALKKSGSSIATTSFTSIAVFATGTITALPFLQSFCVYAMFGIFFLFIFEIAFFVSCLVIDERRLESTREGFCCQPKPDWRPNECSKTNVQRRFFEELAILILSKKVVKGIVLLTTFVFLVINIRNVSQLENHFDPLWYLDQNSYPIRYYEELMTRFPKLGNRAGIYMTGVDYYDDRQILSELLERLRNNTFINAQSLEPWFFSYEKWLLNRNYEIDTKDQYYKVLTEYLLFTKEGQSYIKDIKFDQVPIGDYKIISSRIPILHIAINTSDNQIQAMKSVRNAINIFHSKKESSHLAVFCPEYGAWATNKIIEEESLRNFCLEIIAIALMTVLLQNIQVTIWVVSCVIFTLLDLLGTMYFLGLSIEIFSSIMILVCAGLAVDYATHVGLEFSKAEGSRNERLIAMLGIIGPAVFNGGFSAFLAIVLLSFSDAYLFRTFFKLFSSVVFYGLFHGLIFLPVILSMFGPMNETNNVEKEKNDVLLEAKHTKAYQRLKLESKILGLLNSKCNKSSLLSYSKYRFL